MSSVLAFFSPHVYPYFSGNFDALAFLQFMGSKNDPFPTFYILLSLDQVGD